MEEGLEPWVVQEVEGGAAGEEEGLQQSPMEMKPQSQGGSGCLSCSAEFE